MSHIFPSFFPSLPLFFRPLLLPFHPLFVFPPPSPQNRFVPLLLFIGSRFRETPIDQNIFSRESRDGVAHCLPTSGTIFMANIKPVRFTEGGNERERERERITAEAQFIKFFPLAWFETPLPKHRHSSTTTAPTITINSRTCLSGREERGEGKKSASTVKTTNPIPGPRIDHRDD